MSTVGSESEEEERSSSKFLKNKESTSKQNVQSDSSSSNVGNLEMKVALGRSDNNILDGNSSSTDAKEGITKALDHGSTGKKKKKPKRSSRSRDSQENSVEENSSSLPQEEKLSKESHDGVSCNKRKKSKRRSSSDVNQNDVSDASASHLDVEEEFKANSDDVAQKSKKKKLRASSESEDIEEKKVPMLTDPNLPFGWRRECIQRKTGKTAGHYDVYIYSPAGKKFRSRVELAKFLAFTESDLDPENFDFTVFGCGGYSPNVAIKKKLKSILQSITEKKDLKTKNVTPDTDRLSETVKVKKRTAMKEVRKSKEKKTPVLPQKKKARFKYTPTVNEIFKCTSKDSFCLTCGKTACKFPRVVLEHPPRPLDLLVKEGIKYR